MKISVDEVEREVSRLWSDEARSRGAARTELFTLVALVSTPELLDRARKVVSAVACVHACRTIVAVWRDGDPPGIRAEVELHRAAAGGPACGDAIVLEAIGEAREWLPGNADRLALPDMPVCVWWVGDLPDHDDLFDRMVVDADVVIVNSQEMDLRDLEKLASIAKRSRGRYALADLAWIRLRSIQDLVARFFDDEAGRACISAIQRIEIDFSPRENEEDAASTRSGLLFGWMAHRLQLPTDSPRWTRGEGWAEVILGPVVTRFEARSRPGVRPGGVVRLAIECAGSRFEIAREEDPQVFRWSRDVPGAPTPPQLLRVRSLDETTLLVWCLERPKRDPLLEASMEVGSLIVRPVAPRLSLPPVTR